jgi:protein gp37
MAENSKIEWTDHTFNHVIGCTKVAAGCANCYAERDFDKRRRFAQWGPHGTRVLTSEAYWRKPLKWNREAEQTGVRKRVFCASLADVFEEWDGNFPDNPPGVHGGVRCLVDHDGDRLCTRVGVERAKQWPDEPGWRPYTMVDARGNLFELIDATPWLDWLLLTKRPENVLRMWPAQTLRIDPEPWRRNVWLGASIANQEDANRNVPELLKCRDLSPVLFVSAEPLLGPVNLFAPTLKHYQSGHPSERLDWVIVGGESGPGARPFDMDWARSLRDQCARYGMAFFMKQTGSVWAKAHGIPGKGDRLEDLPEDLRIRDFPKG